MLFVSLAALKNVKKWQSFRRKKCWARMCFDWLKMDESLLVFTFKMERIVCIILKKASLYPAYIRLQMHAVPFAWLLQKYLFGSSWRSWKRASLICRCYWGYGHRMVQVQHSCSCRAATYCLLELVFEYWVFLIELRPARLCLFWCGRV